MTAPSSRPDTPAQQHAEDTRIQTIRDAYRWPGAPCTKEEAEAADAALDSLAADLEAAREALELLARSDGWGDYFRCGCMDEVNRIASAALARLSAGKETT